MTNERFIIQLRELARAVDVERKVEAAWAATLRETNYHIDYINRRERRASKLGVVHALLVAARTLLET